MAKRDKTTIRIQGMLKKSRAFREYISKEKQEEILENAAKLSPQKKVQLIELLAQEYEQLQAQKAKEESILEEMNDSLDLVIKRAVKEAKQTSEKEEKRQAEEELNKKIQNI